MKLHERTFLVTKAKLDLEQALLDIIQKAELTPGEVVSILTQIAPHYVNMVLRYERHGTLDKKADEA